MSNTPAPQPDGGEKKPLIQVNLPTAAEGEGSQNPLVVALATLVCAAFSLGCLYFLWEGPSQNSVFRALRSPLMFYSVMGVGALLFARITWVGVKRVRLLLARKP